jgi:hypothetical protein
MEFAPDKLLAVFLIAVCWAMLDKIRWNYQSTIFARIGSGFLQKWLNPALSQKNKWSFKSNVLKFVFSTMLVWTTDLWHLLKTILLFVIFYFLWKLEPESEWQWQVLIMFFVYGVSFEIIYSIDWFWWIKRK